MNHNYPQNPSEYMENLYQEREYMPELQSVQRPGNMPGSMPSSPPPSYIPRRSAQTMFVDPGSIRNCLYRFTYVWQVNGDEYWMFPTRVSRTTVSGFRWNSRRRWGFFGVSLNQIASFMCR